MLRKLQLNDFKSFSGADLELAPLTVLVGLNGSGKSNVLDAVRLLKGVASGFRLAETLGGEARGGVPVWDGIRGGLAEAVRVGRKTATLESTWEIAGQAFSHQFTFKADAAAEQPVALVEREEIRLDGRTIVTSEWLDEPPEPGLDYVAFRDGVGLPADPGSSELTYPLLRRSQEGVPRDLLAPLRDVLAGSLFLDIRPALMRGWVARTAPDVGHAGEHLSAVLARREADPARKAGLEDWIAELLGGEARGIEILRAPTGEVLFALVDGAGARVTARSVSDGTLRFLGQVVALEEVAPGRTLFIEEPEQGLHPSRVHLLVQKLEAETATGEKQVVLTTHSPAFLNWLSRDRWPGVLLVARDPVTHGSIVRRVVDLPGFDRLPPKLLLGELLASGWLEQAL